MSVVPPPMSTTMLPDASVIGMPGADRRRHRFFDQVHFARLGAHRAVLHRAPLDLRDLRRHADDDARPQPAAALVRLADEVRQHLLGRLEVGDDAVLHRLDRGDVAGRAAEHLLRLVADRLDAAVDLVQRDDRRLADEAVVDKIGVVSACFGAKGWAGSWACLGMSQVLGFRDVIRKLFGERQVVVVNLNRVSSS